MWRYIRRGFSLALLLAVIAVGVGAGFAQKDGGKLLSVQTGSMVPAIDKGSLVSVKRVPNSNLKVGDVITYISPKNTKVTITHRIVVVPSPATKGMVITKGDANSVTDSPFTTKYIVGRVDHSIPYLGHAVDFVRKPIGLAILIYIPALAIMINEIKILSQQFRRMRPYLSNRVMQRFVTNKQSRSKFAPVAMATPLGLIISLAIVAPVQALLKSNSVVLANNSFSVEITAPPLEGPHVTFRKVVMRCSSDNTVSKNVRPIIVVQNWTHQNFVANGWKIVDNSGTIINIPEGMEFKRLRQYQFTPLLSDGLQYSGDRLVLQNSLGQKIDALSWGTDTTAFDPSIQNVTSGDRLDRRPFNVDTDTASDWRVFDHQCWCPDRPDVEEGSDAGELGDQNETNRVQAPNTFNLEEL